MVSQLCFCGYILVSMCQIKLDCRSFPPCTRMQNSRTRPQFMLQAYNWVQCIRKPLQCCPHTFPLHISLRQWLISTKQIKLSLSHLEIPVVSNILPPFPTANKIIDIQVLSKLVLWENILYIASHANQINIVSLL